MSQKPKKTLVVLGVLVIFVLWLLTGIYTVDSKGGEEAVVLRFGEYVQTEKEAGLHWHLPSPIERVYKEKVNEVKTIEIGFRTIRGGSTVEMGVYKQMPEESLMLTGDENMVNVETVIQYKIINIVDYLFNVDDQEDTLIISAESAIRRVIASHLLDEALTDNKFGIQQEIRDDLQDLCDNYEIGIGISAVKLQDVEAPDEVDAAFKDVANAREDKNSYINEAQSYANEIIPKARGNAAEMINDAEAYKEKRIAEAKGDVANFVQILEKYQLGKEVTRTRMYLEMLEEVLPGVEKYILNGEGNTLNFLPLQMNTNENEVIN